MNRTSLQRVYLTIAVVWGLALVVLVPPFQIPDEPAHFYRSWSIAQGQFVQPPGYLVSLPKSVFALEAQFPVWDIALGKKPGTFIPGKIPRLLTQPIASPSTKQVATVPSASPVGYLPQVVAIRLALLVGRSPLGALYLARLFNLVASVLLVYFAIRLAPYGKALFMLAALFPVTLSEMAGVSPDGIMIGGAFLFCALVLHLAQRPKLATRNMIGALVAALLLLTVKPGYFAMCVLLLMLSPRQFGGRRHYWFWVVGIFAVTLGATVLEAAALPHIPSQQALLPGGPVGVDAIGQLRFVVAHPFFFLSIVRGTFAGAAIALGHSMIGLLSWLSLRLSDWVVLGMVALLFVAVTGFSDTALIRPAHRAVLAATWTASALSVCLLTYAGLNAVGTKGLSGLQGRYFTPFLPLLLLVVYRPRFGKRQVALAVIVVALIAVAMSTMRAIWYFYFW